MKEQLTKALSGLKEQWGKLSKKAKAILATVAGGILLVAVALTVFLNMSKSGYKVLYPNISDEEATQVYATLQSMEVTPELNAKGEIMVPRDQWDTLVLDLAGKGFPKSAPAYGMFLNNTSFTMTEFEKKEVLRFQLQDRLQETLQRIEGVESAIVNITIPESSNYVWREDSDKSTASVLITMVDEKALSSDKVSAIRNLVAFSVPKMAPADVSVIDSMTGIEMDGGGANAELESGIDFKRIEYERAIAKDIEDNVKRLLTPTYGPNNVTAVAKVKLNYDKLKSETRELMPEDNGKGIMTHDEEQYSVNGRVPAQGIVGEENNTDVPNYANQTGDTGTGEVTDYNRSADYDISTKITQLEQAQGIIEEASLAVIVKDANFDQARQDLLTDLISKSVNLDVNSITVTNLEMTEDGEPADTQPEPQPAQPINLTRLLIFAGAGLLVVLLLVLVLVLILRRKKKKTVVPTVENTAIDLQAEIEDRKRVLVEAAQANSQESAIADEVREFAKENPEITASLIRSMLKEDEA